MTHKIFVTKDQAIALKELGFNEQCLAHFEISGLVSNSELSDDWICLDDLYKRYNGTNEYVYDAPTLYQAQQWLIKNKKYSIEPHYDDGWVCCITDIKTGEWENIDAKYDTYEDALLTGINEYIENNN